jgi:hypothetical protein
LKKEFAMIRQIIAGLFIALAVAGCNRDSEPVDATNGNPGDRQNPGDEGDICGGFAGLKCDADLYCDFPSETKCGSGDQAGVCKEPPGACTKEYNPVCGCDGITYGNACTAANSKQSVRHTGECVQQQSGR